MIAPPKSGQSTRRRWFAGRSLGRPSRRDAGERCLKRGRLVVGLPALIYFCTRWRLCALEVFVGVHVPDLRSGIALFSKSPQAELAEAGKLHQDLLADAVLPEATLQVRDFRPAQAILCVSKAFPCRGGRLLGGGQAITIGGVRGQECLQIAASVRFPNGQGCFLARHLIQPGPR